MKHNKINPILIIGILLSSLSHIILHLFFMEQPVLEAVGEFISGVSVSLILVGAILHLTKGKLKKYKLALNINK